MNEGLRSIAERALELRVHGSADGHEIDQHCRHKHQGLGELTGNNVYALKNGWERFGKGWWWREEKQAGVLTALTAKKT